MQRGAPKKAPAGPPPSSAPKVKGSAGYPNAAPTLLAANAPKVKGNSNDPAIQKANSLNPNNKAYWESRNMEMPDQNRVQLEIQRKKERAVRV